MTKRVCSSGPLPELSMSTLLSGANFDSSSGSSGTSLADPLLRATAGAQNMVARENKACVIAGVASVFTYLLVTYRYNSVKCPLFTHFNLLRRFLIIMPSCKSGLTRTMFCSTGNFSVRSIVMVLWSMPYIQSVSASCGQEGE